MFPASEASAPFGIRIATGGMCSNESGIDKSRTFMAPSESGAQNSTRRRAGAASVRVAYRAGLNSRSWKSKLKSVAGETARIFA